MDIHSPYVCIDTVSIVNMYTLRKISGLKETEGDSFCQIEFLSFERKQGIKDS